VQGGRAPDRARRDRLDWTRLAPRTSAGGLRFLAAAAIAAPILPACGASIQAVYEGDVRFEHCMALDARPDVKPTLRRVCWKEWLKFYTFGQTRDRLEYARVRGKQPGTTSDLEEGDWVTKKASGPPAGP